MTSTYQELGSAIGAIVDQKNKSYGSSFAKAGDFLRLLWPDGVPAHRYEDLLLLARIFDKQMRIATDKDALGESPYADIAGYGTLGASLHQESRGTWQGSVSDPDAPNQSKAQPGSAAPLTSHPTTPSASEPAASETSQPPASSSPQPTDATASTAADSALESVAARAKVRNEIGFCANITHFAHLLPLSGSVALCEDGLFHGIGFCNQKCVREFKDGGLLG